MKFACGLGKWFALASLLFTLRLPCLAQKATGKAFDPKAPELAWKQSLPLVWGDPAIVPIGGTEVRQLEVFDHKLFAANGYWMDTSQNNPALPGPQVLRLDSPDSAWKVDLELKEWNPRGLRMYLAISALKDVRLTTDRAGRPLEQPVDLLLASVWKRGIGLDLFWRTAESSRWSKTTIPGQEEAPRGTQIRAFATHKDTVTGADVVFAGATKEILAGRYDRKTKAIVWDAKPEWHLTPGDAPNSAKGRVASFADCNGKIYAGAFDTIYEREDGATPVWKKVFQTEVHSPSEHVTGLRGLTCIRDRTATKSVLMASVEDNPARIYRIDLQAPNASGGFSAKEDLDVSTFLTDKLGVRATYGIIAYNDMTLYPAPHGDCTNLVMGLESNVPQNQAGLVETFRGKHLAEAYYLARDCNGKYTLHEIVDPQIGAKAQLESTRTMAVSPFPGDPAGTLYAGGFDANSNPVHNTGWIYKGVPVATR